MRHCKKFLFAAALLLLAACSDTKERLGLTRSLPDEFAVVKRAPLALPPDYNLRPPQPGAPRPQEPAADALAREVVLGDAAAQVSADIDNLSKGEYLLLEQAGATTVDAEIRRRVDAETAAQGDYQKPVAQKLLGIGGDDAPPATVVNAKKEAERLKKNQQEGKPVTEGDTPSVNR